MSEPSAAWLWVDHFLLWVIIWHYLGRQFSAWRDRRRREQNEDLKEALWGLPPRRR